MSIQVIEENLGRLLHVWERIYVEKTRRSKELFERARKALPGGVTLWIG